MKKDKTPTADEHYARGEEILAAIERGENVRPDAASIATAHFAAAHAIVAKRAAELANGLVTSRRGW